MKKDGKAAIVDSFKLLLNKKSIDKITVKAVCEDCQVNRQTFYNHFADIMDVFKYILLKELSEDIAQNRTFDTWQGGFMATMNYFKKYRKMVMHVYNSSYWPEANRYVINLSKALLDHVVAECVEKMGVKLNERDQEFIVDFYRYLFVGFIIDWVSEGMEEEPEDILKRLLLMITGSIPRSVSAFVRQKK